MLLNHPETLPHHPVHGKIVFHETSPSAEKVGDHWEAQNSSPCHPFLIH